MDPVPTAIPAASERQALDWSLVLVSQGIETVIEREAEAGPWRLVVEPPDYDRALRVLELYRSENGRAPWRQALPWPALVLDWRCLIVLLGFVLLFAVEAAGRGDLRAMGRMDNLALRSGDWWRPFTAVTLHTDFAHLAGNVVTGLLFIGLAMGAYGPGVSLLGAYCAGVGGFGASLLLLPAQHLSLGASGMVLGALGLLTAQWFALLRHGLTGKQLAARGLTSGVLLLVLLGVSPASHVDVLAHVAGFLSGLFVGAVLAFLPPRLVRSGWTNALAGLLFAAMVLVPWRRAME